MKKSRYEYALEAVKLGRASLLGYFGKISQIESKEKAGLVSEADRETEKIIQNYLKENCPDVDFLGEEQSFAEGENFIRDFKGARWILDPLDGTTNYVHQFPIFCISLALEVNGVLEIAIIDVPMLNQTWTAQKGQGAFCDGKKISVSKTSEFKDSLLATGFSDYLTPDLMNQQLEIFSKLMKQARGIRRAGAAAYDLALVSSGVFDMFWERNLKPWDTAAGQLLIEEAGGVVKNFSGDRHNPFDSGIVAGNPILVEKFLKEMDHK
jgi:myo-inositol-1(or 4)-monophosphatase